MARRSFALSANAAVSSSNQTPTSRDVVLYQRPQTADGQNDLLRQADAGDLQARLELMTPGTVEAELRRRHRQDQPDCTLLDYLEAPGADLTRADAAAHVLNELADTTEQVSLDSALVWRYIQLHKLWETHDNPALRTAESFLANLDQNALVKINIVVGTSAQADKRRSITIIKEAWGGDWFAEIPSDLLPEDVSDPMKLSKRLLIQIAANCRKNISLQTAISGWREQLNARCNPARQSDRSKRPRLTTHILPEDVAFFNKRHDEQRGRRTAELFFPEVQEDRLQLFPPSTAVGEAESPWYGQEKVQAVSKSQSKRKASRAPAKGSTDLSESTGDDRGQETSHLSADGKYRIKRVGKQLIREPVTPASTPASSPARSVPSQIAFDGSTPCGAPDVAAMLSRVLKEVQAFMPREGDPRPSGYDKYCSTCLEDLSKIARCYEETLLPLLNKVKDGDPHASSTPHTVIDSTGREDNRTTRQRRRPLFVESDEEETLSLHSNDEIE